MSVSVPIAAGPGSPSGRNEATGSGSKGRTGRTGRGTLAEDLRRQIADAIFDGHLPPGQRLDEQEVAARYGVSRTPVREAFRLLAATGLVQARPNRGAVVATIAPERLAEMFEAMGEMEAACARLAALRMTAQERHDFARLHEASGALSRAGDIDGYDRENTLFHSLVYAGSHNSYLNETSLAMRRRLRPYRRAQFRVTGRLDLSWFEHDAVVRAILRGDGEAAYHAMRLHVTTVGDASAGLMARLPLAEAPL